MKRNVYLFIVFFLVGNLLMAGCYSKPPGSEPQKPSDQSSEKK